MTEKQPKMHVLVKIPEPDICAFDSIVNKVVKTHSASQMRGYAHDRVKEALSRQHREIERLTAELEALRKENAKCKLHIATLNRTLGHILPKPEAIAQAVQHGN